MASLGTITFGSQDEGNSTVDADVGTPPMESISGASESTYVHTDNNNSADEVSYTPLGNTPGDFATMDTLSYQLRYLRSANGPDKAWDSLRIQIFQSDRSTPLTNEMTVASAITTTTATNSSVVAFTGVQSGSQSLWDGAIVAIWFYKTKAMGGESDDFRVTAGEVTGTYTAGVPEVFGVAALSGTGDISVSGLHIGIGVATLSGTGAISVSGIRTTFEVATLPGTGSISVSGTRTTFGAATLSGTGAMSVSGARVVLGVATLSGTGTLSADGSVFVLSTVFGVATLSGTGNLSTSAFISTFGLVTLSGTGSLTVQGLRETFEAATLTGTGDLSASGFVTAIVTGSATLSGVGDLYSFGVGDSNDPPVDPYDPTAITRRGAWFRLNDRILWCGHRIFQSVQNWERVTPLIYVNAGKEQEMWIYVYNELRNHADDSVEDTMAAMVTLLTGLYPILE